MTFAGNQSVDVYSDSTKGDAMGLMDRVDQAQGKRRIDAMYVALGAAVYAERTGRGDIGNTKKIERLLKLISEEEASHGWRIIEEP